MDTTTRIAQALEARRADILGLSRDIHAAPELAFEDVRTSRLLRSVLEAEGFEVGPATDTLPTSFRAVHGSGRPRVTFTAEMDALPGLGHACGHNIIGAAGVYAAVVLKAALGRDIPGAIEVVATPAEERGSGKAAQHASPLYASPCAHHLRHRETSTRRRIALSHSPSPP